MRARTVLLGLGLLATLLVTLISMEMQGGPPEEDASGIVAIRHLPKPRPHAVAAAPLDRTDEWAANVLARPLFSRDRRPTPPAAKGGGPSFTGLPRLSGVIVGTFGRTAIFAGTGGAKSVSVGVGKTLGPYLIEAIEPDGVTVSGPAGEQHVTLTADAAIRSQLAAELPRVLAPALQPAAVPGLPVGSAQLIVPRRAVPGLPGTAQQRLNMQLLRQGQRLPVVSGIQPNQEGSK